MTIENTAKKRRAEEFNPMMALGIASAAAGMTLLAAGPWIEFGDNHHLNLRFIAAALLIVSGILEAGVGMLLPGGNKDFYEGIIQKQKSMDADKDDVDANRSAPSLK